MRVGSAARRKHVIFFVFVWYFQFLNFVLCGCVCVFCIFFDPAIFYYLLGIGKIAQFHQGKIPPKYNDIPPKNADLAFLLCIIYVLLF